MKTLYLLIGLWGSGKTTWSRDFVKKNRKTKIVSADGFRSMMNGEYEYLAELDDIIDCCMIDTANHLLEGGYDVIIDACNLTSERRARWLDGIKADIKTAVVFPYRDKEWHLKNRKKEIHRFDSDEVWDKMFDKQIAAFEPVDGAFDGIIEVKEWSM